MDRGRYLLAVSVAWLVPPLRDTNHEIRDTWPPAAAHLRSRVAPATPPQRPGQELTFEGCRDLAVSEAVKYHAPRE